ncbi:hypothetical protein HK105_200080 [Polyrhizophydium stewartii]|uniref:Enkurin domain-containing protein n=1 Tax=Polyrhizophydium stewartii TaxID=2732419 RepID=A0ABR4NKQ6_9FUNG
MATAAAPHQFPAAQATAARAKGPQVDPRTKPVPIPGDPHDETVYRLIPEEYVVPPKEQRYRSQFADQARGEYNSNRKSTASMGPAKVQVNHPSEFLKRGDRAKITVPGEPALAAEPAAIASEVGAGDFLAISDFASFRCALVDKGQPDRTVRKAPVPKTLGDAIQPSHKNFIKQNALDNINSSAKKTQKSHPSYLAKRDYGRTPDYLKRCISELKEQEYRHARELLEMESSKNVHEGVVPLPDEERSKILNGLKANWEKLNSDYQRLSLTVDTVPKIARKVNMEQQLKQYEELIEKFSHTNIHLNFSGLFN